MKEVDLSTRIVKSKGTPDVDSIVLSKASNALFAAPRRVVWHAKSVDGLCRKSRRGPSKAAKTIGFAADLHRKLGKKVVGKNTGARLSDSGVGDTTAIHANTFVRCWAPAT